MTYSNGRIINDADAHTMETQDWLAPYLEGELKEKYSGVYSKREGGERIVEMIDKAMERRTDPEARKAAAENPIGGAKGWLGYGGFDKEERVEALDFLGFQSQLVFPTFGLAAIQKAENEDLRYAAGVEDGLEVDDLLAGIRVERPAREGEVVHGRLTELTQRTPETALVDDAQRAGRVLGRRLLKAPHELARREHQHVEVGGVHPDDLALRGHAGVAPRRREGLHLRVVVLVAVGAPAPRGEHQREGDEREAE